MGGLTVRLFGAFAFVVDGRVIASPSTVKARALVAYLLNASGRAIARERIAETFWPDSDLDRARSSVGTALWSIRRALRGAGLDPDAFVRADALTMTWHGDTDSDVARFEATVREDPARAVAWYGGPFLDGIYDEWTVRERERLESLYEAALARALDASTTTDDDDVERNARLMVERDPYSEAAWTALIENVMRVGARARARTIFARALAAFAEAGIPPDEAFVARFRSLAGDSATHERLPFVGRDAEIERVLRALHAPTARGGVAVVGQAGVGKTELLRHLGPLLESGDARIVHIAPQHQRYGLQQLEDLAERMSGRTAAALREQAPDGVPAAVASSLLAAEDVIYLIDDLHWAHGDALDVLLMLAAAPRRAVIAMRPEGRSLLQRNGVADVIELRELDRASVMEALRASTPSQGERERLYAMSGGYPLALDALLRAPGARESLAGVPDVVRLLLERRLDERGEAASRAASLFALEPALTPEAAAAVLDIPIEQLLDAFDDLYALGVLVDDAGGPAFCHDLFADVAQRRLPPARRRMLHARIAGALDPDRHAARYAHHLAQARQPLDAARAYLQAARASFTHGAFGDARTLLEAGLDALSATTGDAALELRIALRIELARALADGGRQSEAVAAVERAAAEARAARRDDLVFRALLLRNRFGIEMGSVRGAEARDGDLDELLALAERLPAELASVQALSLAARGTMNRSLALADRYASSALTLARRLRDTSALADALQASATLAILRGDIARAIDETAELIPLAQRLGTVRASRAHTLHGVTHLLARRFEEASTFGRGALALAAEPLPEDDLLRVSRWRLEMIALELLTYVELQRGDAEAAIVWARRREALEAQSPGDRCESAAALAVALVCAHGRASADESAALLAPFAHADATIQRRYMLESARAIVALAREEAGADAGAAIALESCRAVPPEEAITLHLWLEPLAHVARRAGHTHIADDAEAMVAQIEARRRAGSGAFWRETAARQSSRPA